MNDQKAIKDRLQSLEGREIEITIEPRERVRSVQWNKYYWKVIVAFISKESGNTPDQTHKGLKEKYLPHIIRCKEDTGERYILDTTTVLNNKEFRQFIMLIITGEADYYKLPEPNEIDYE